MTVTMLEEDIRQQFITAEIGIKSEIETDTDNIILGTVPTNPGNVIVIGSSEGVLTALENSTLSSQSIMVQKAVSLPNMPDVRQTLSIIAINTNYTAVHEKIWRIYNELIGENSGYKVCNGRQMYFVPIQPPYLYKTDANGKIFFILNVTVNSAKETTGV